MRKYEFTECSVEGCTDIAEVKGMCRRHYKQMLYHKNKTTTRNNSKNKGNKCLLCDNEAKIKGLCKNHYNAELIKITKPKLDRTCKIDGCNIPVKTRGMCQKHYTRWMRTGVAETTTQNENKGKMCIICGKREAVSKGMCRNHYKQLWLIKKLTPEERSHRTCIAPDCNLGIHHPSTGLCYRHHRELQKHGRLSTEDNKLYTDRFKHSIFEPTKDDRCKICGKPLFTHDVCLTCYRKNTYKKTKYKYISSIRSKL